MAGIHRMLLISTGGTIAGEVATSKKSATYQVAKADVFSDVIKDTVTHLKQTSGIELRIEPDEYVTVDSSDIKPEHWMELVRKIEQAYDDFDSFVITHGTNTLGYTCAALSFALINPGKPIILTGSQVPINLPGSDAKTNLDNAIRLATWNRKNQEMRGVICVFGSHIITGTRVKKDTEFDYDAFRTFQSGSIGRIGRIIDINQTNLDKHLKYHSSESYPVARKRETLRCANQFDNNIVSFTEFPGMKYEILQNLVDNCNIRGIIIRAFGAGDMSTSSFDVLRSLKQQQIPIVVTSQAPNGNANLQVNEPGQRLLSEDLVIPAHDMSIESQTAKLMWLLAKRSRGELKFEQLKEQMITDMRGEIDVDWEAEYGL